MKSLCVIMRRDGDDDSVGDDDGHDGGHVPTNYF